jgi:four helix bundle protein
MSKNLIKDKSFLYVIEIVDLYKFFVNDEREFVMSKQLLKCGTSVGANVREVLNAESKSDFIHKLSSAQKECDEVIYWLDLMKATKYINEQSHFKYKSEAEALLKILKSIILTTRQNQLKTHNS